MLGPVQPRIPYSLWRDRALLGCGWCSCFGSLQVSPTATRTDTVACFSCSCIFVEGLCWLIDGLQRSDMLQSLKIKGTAISSVVLAVDMNVTTDLCGFIPVTTPLVSSYEHFLFWSWSSLHSCWCQGDALVLGSMLLFIFSPPRCFWSLAWKGEGFFPFPFIFIIPQERMRIVLKDILNESHGLGCQYQRGQPRVFGIDCNYDKYQSADCCKQDHFSIW